jgi:hypothetical protein
VQGHGKAGAILQEDAENAENKKTPEFESEVAALKLKEISLCCLCGLQ